jgi:hypothetical protein
MFMLPTLALASAESSVVLAFAFVLAFLTLFVLPFGRPLGMIIY